MEEQEKTMVIAIPEKASNWESNLLQPWQGIRAGDEGSFLIKIRKRGHTPVLLGVEKLQSSFHVPLA